MSATKPVRIFDRLVWVYDNSHDVVVAHLVEAAEANGYGALEVVNDWRVWASVMNLGFQYPYKDAPPVATMHSLLGDVRTRITTRGDVVRSDIESWSVLDGTFVSDGFLRAGRLSVAVLGSVVDAFDSLLDGTYPADPAGAAWYIGLGAEPETIPMRAT